MRYIVLFLFIFPFSLLTSPLLSAQQAVIRDLAGTVEILEPGSDKWQPAQRGQIISGNTTISTFFRSTAVIAIGESVLVMRPITMITLTELIQIRENERVELNLRTGRVRAEVNPPAGGKTDFTVRSNRGSTAVRGTIFEVDTYSVFVSKGSVEFEGVRGPPIIIDAGGTSFTDGRTGRATPPRQTADSELIPTMPYGWERTRPGYSGNPFTPGMGEGNRETFDLDFTFKGR